METTPIHPKPENPELENTPAAGPEPSKSPEPSAPAANAPEVAVRPRRCGWGRRLLAIAVALGLLAAAGAGGAWVELGAWHARPHGAAGETALTIKPGTSTRAIAEQLSAAGLISDPYRLLAWLRLRGRVGGIQAGEYRISTPIAPQALLEKLARGSFAQRLTIPEGWTARRIAGRLKAEGWIADEGAWQALVARPVAEQALGFEVPEGAEGFCFPDTYALEAGMPAEKILRRMLAQFRRNWEAARPAERDGRSAALTPREVVVLAAMVEREARVADEMPLIAGVYLNRLARGMKLQSCATVHYALGEVWNRALTYEDLKVDSPFNTYRNAGLPPGPIANPGRAALEAVLRPAPTDALFYVYRGEGRHIFSRTYAEHAKAVRELRKARPGEAVMEQDGAP